MMGMNGSRESAKAREVCCLSFLLLASLSVFLVTEIVRWDVALKLVMAVAAVVTVAAIFVSMILWCLICGNGVEQKHQQYRFLRVLWCLIYGNKWCVFLETIGYYLLILIAYGFIFYSAMTAGELVFSGARESDAILKLCAGTIISAIAVGLVAGAIIGGIIGCIIYANASELHKAVHECEIVNRFATMFITLLFLGIAGAIIGMFDVMHLLPQIFLVFIAATTMTIAMIMVTDVVCIIVSRRMIFCLLLKKWWRNFFEMGIFPFLSPTRTMAGYLKRKDKKRISPDKYKIKRSQVIKALNSLCLCIALVGIVASWIFQDPIKSDKGLMGLEYVWGYYLLSRCNEIFYAFLKDAYEKAKDISPMSSLKTGDRIALALKSYLELIINFAILYLLMPADYWDLCKQAPSTIADALYFSGATITTLGDSNIVPMDPLLRLLTIYEILCGLILLVVCFAIYPSRNK